MAGIINGPSKRAETLCTHNRIALRQFHRGEQGAPPFRSRSKSNAVPVGNRPATNVRHDTVLPALPCSVRRPPRQEGSKKELLRHTKERTFQDLKHGRLRFLLSLLSWTKVFFALLSRRWQSASTRGFVRPLRAAAPGTTRGGDIESSSRPQAVLALRLKSASRMLGTAFRRPSPGERAH